jgi:protein-tyrosine-phosphatase
MAVEAMDELGIEIGRHKPRSFDDLEDTAFDLVISLSPEAQHKAVELTRTSAVELEYWPTVDPTAVEGSREQRLDAYRAVRDQLMRRIRSRFSVARAGDA